MNQEQLNTSESLLVSYGELNPSQKEFVLGLFQGKKIKKVDYVTGNGKVKFVIEGGEFDELYAGGLTRKEIILMRFC